jgi:redox-sensitive bicupin YhaK (pirin superfamily)
MSEIRLFPLGFPWETSDPFLFCVHHLDRYPKGNSDMGPDASLAGRNIGSDFEGKDGWNMYHGQIVPGFPAHPHCGFETVTIVTRGFCDHSDSLGAAARFGEGDAQWITTGRGLQHSEMFPLLKTEESNTLELFQIWLNLPRKSKFADPNFSMYWKEEIPVWEEEGVTVVLIAGSLNGITALSPPPDSWAADIENDVHIGIINLSANSAFNLPKVQNGSIRRLYLFEGDQVTVGGKNLPNGSGAMLPEDEVFIKTGRNNARLLWLQGKPISEPVARYGPFVMNESEEIQNAINQFRTTQFGGWPWRHQDPVHHKNSGRFAIFPDGTKIIP